VLAIDPEPRGENVESVALLDLDESAASFDAAVAITSLHHVEPLAESLRRLADVLRPGAPLLIDEFDVGAFDQVAAAWWLERRRTLGVEDGRTADELVHERRSHLHPLHRIIETLEEQFEVGAPVRGAYLYRWALGPELRPEEEDALASGELPAVGARLVARRRAGPLVRAVSRP